MEKNHCILFIEDSEDDARLIALALRRAGIQADWQRVETASELLRALGTRDWDAILADYSVPGFNAHAVLRLLAERGSDIPVIVVSGVVDEEQAVSVMRAGAADFVVKSRLARLPVALLRETRERENRRKHREDAGHLAASQAHLTAQHAVASALARSNQLHEAISPILQAISPCFGWSSSGVWLFDRDLGLLVCKGVWESPELGGSAELHLARRPSLALGDGMAGQVWAQERAVCSEDACRDGSLSHRQDCPGGGCVRGAAFPIRSSGRVIGAIDAYYYGDSCPSPELLKTMETIGTQIGIFVERRSAEEQLRQAQKMEAIGSLAGGVAHDFNNILTAIIGFSDFILESLPAEAPQRSDAESIRRAAGRAADLTRQLLAFGRKQLLRMKAVDLNAVVAETERILRRIIGEDVDLQTRLGAGLWPVMADPGQIGQVLMNLAVNARDAMPDGGVLSIETANVELEPPDVQGNDREKRSYVRLRISDTGTGMDAAVRARVFEPFFTTKPQGKGTGLGLSMVYGIVKQTGGFIEVQSEPGMGTTFRILLPAAPEISIEGPARSPAAVASPGHETILVVEDEDLVRGLTCRALRRAGYAVLEASNGSEALDLYATQSSPPDLVITDVVMPVMGGCELARKLSASHPNLRLLFVSGYADEATVGKDGLAAGMPVLSKPFTPDALCAKVREILDES